MGRDARCPGARHVADQGTRRQARRPEDGCCRFSLHDPVQPGVLELLRAGHLPEHVRLRSALLVPPAGLFLVQANSGPVRHEEAQGRRLQPHRHRHRHPRQPQLPITPLHGAQPARLDRLLGALQQDHSPSLALGRLTAEGFGLAVDSGSKPPGAFLRCASCYKLLTDGTRDHHKRGGESGEMRAKDRRRYGWAAMAASVAAVLILVVTAGAAGTAVVDPSFVPGPAFDAGYAPTGVAVADFNRDHVPDLAVANCLDEVDADGIPERGSEVTILLGDGSGGVRPGAPPPLPAGAWTCSLASADFNGDGSPDLAVMDSVAKTIAILLGDGTGHFAPAGGSPGHVNGTPRSVVAADVNGDGRPDLVVPVANSSGRVTGIEVLLGDGSGGFSEAPGSPVSILAGADISVAVADLDGDGKADLAVANTQKNEISVLRGAGTGAFGPLTTVGSARNPHDIAIGDFDGNGKPDLAALVSNGVAVLLGDGLGSFHAPAGSPLPGSGDDLAVADLNGDGKSDIATSSADGGSVSVWVATGGGAFRPAAFSPFAAEYPSL